MAPSDSELPHAVPDFIGRAAELTILEQCAARARAGCPWVVWVSGAAGIGKTMLVRRFLGALDGFTVMAASAQRARQAEAYAVLGMLLSGHHRALNAVETSVVAAAATVLAVLGERQARGPVAVVVDDVQWADAYSVRALAFVLRRLVADQVLVVLVCREDVHSGPSRPAELDVRRDTVTEIRLGGLSAPEVAALVETHAGGTISAPAAEWMRSHTRGHPLHVRALLVEGVMSWSDERNPRPGTPSLDATIVEWFHRQPAHTQRLLEALAVVDTRFPLLRLARLAGVADPAAAVEPAVAAGFVDWCPSDPASPVALRHPLHREALYAALSPSRRSRLHAAAVALVDRRSGWAHRVAAATGTDDRLAADLERAADDEAARGEYETAANYLRWAAELSAPRAEYERRLLTGALLSLRDYRTTWATRLTGEITACAPSALRSCVHGVLAQLRDTDLARAETLLDSAIAASEGHPDLAWVQGTAAAYLATAHLWQGRGAETVKAATLALSTRSLDPLTADGTRMALAVGRSRVSGWTAALRDLQHLPTPPDQVSRTDLESLTCRGALRTMSGELSAARDDLTVVTQAFRAGDRCAMGYAAFGYLTATQYLLGAWDDAALTAYQGLAVVEASEQVFHYALLRMAASLVPAGRGDQHAALAHFRAARHSARTLGTPQDHRYAAITGALHAHAAADYPAMLDALRPVRDLTPAQASTEHLWWHLWWRPLLVDALLGTGHLAEAGRELTDLTQIARDVPYLTTTLSRLHGRLAKYHGQAHRARTHYQQGLDTPADDTDPPLFRAMLEAALGRLQLDTGHRHAAVAHLRAAQRRFHTLGALPYARRCDTDLARCGALDPTRSTPTGPPLSEREYQVVRLVQHGMTNREIATELYLSSKTIEYHLANIFTKLGITNRRQLRSHTPPPR